MPLSPPDPVSMPRSSKTAPVSMQGLAIPGDQFALPGQKPLADFSTHYVASLGQCGLSVAFSVSHETITAEPLNSPSTCSCSFSGTLATDPTNTFYNVRVTFPPNGCTLQNQTVEGIAVFYMFNGGYGPGVQEFLMILTPPNSAISVNGVLDPNNPGPIP